MPHKWKSDQLTIGVVLVNCSWYTIIMKLVSCCKHRCIIHFLCCDCVSTRVINKYHMLFLSQLYMLWSFCLPYCLNSKVAIRFVDGGGFVDHLCIKFLFIIYIYLYFVVILSKLDSRLHTTHNTLVSKSIITIIID